MSSKNARCDNARTAAAGGRPARSAGSLAWAALANSYYWINSAKGVAGVYATQIPSFFDEKAVQAFQAFEYRAI